MTIYSLTYSFSYLELVFCSISSSDCCFLTCIQVSQEAGLVVWYFHLFQEQEIKLLTPTGSSKKPESSRKKNIYFCFINYAKSFDCVDHNKLWKILKEMTNLDSILKSRDITLSTRSVYSKLCFLFSSSHVWMWELDHKESWAPKNLCFWTVVLQKALEGPLNCKEIKPVNPKGN